MRKPWGMIMNKVVCDLTNCYGIQKLHHEFDFSNTNAISIYARNGLMKTSFSKTFRKIQEGKVAEIKDEILACPEWLMLRLMVILFCLKMCLL